MVRNRTILPQMEKQLKLAMLKASLKELERFAALTPEAQRRELAALRQLIETGDLETWEKQRVRN
jgi:hypothetical protein